VERINPFEFYDLARRLHQADPGSAQSLDDAFWTVAGLQTSVKNLIEGKPTELGVSRQLGLVLKGAVDDIVARHFTQQGEDGTNVWKWPTAEDPPIAEWEWAHLKQALGNFEMIFAEEMREAATYRVPQRGIFYTPKLVDAADETFPTEVLGVLPEKTRADWCAAGRCLAFSLLSASGFHVTRAVEGMTEAYYQLFTGKDGTLRSWFDYFTALSEVGDDGPHGKPSAKTLAELDQMRTDYRNPIAHPRVVLSESDARMLYANGESLIIAMAQEIKATRGEPENALLALLPEFLAAGVK
jgi:hypothetical protein